MSKFLVTIDKHESKVASLHYNKKEALDRVEWSKSAYLPTLVAKEIAYKPEPKDVEVSWVLYFTINGTEFSETYRTRRDARWEKKFIQDNLEHFVGKPYNIYIQREELWVVDKKKVS